MSVLLLRISCAQISHTLTRLMENVHPQEFDLDVQKHSSYHGPGKYVCTYVCMSIASVVSI